MKLCHNRANFQRQSVATSACNALEADLNQLYRLLLRNGAVQVGFVSYPDPVVRVNTLSPGYVRTEATTPTLKATPEMERLWEKGNVLGRLTLAHEFRAPILFLQGDSSSFITSDVTVDGGHCAW